MNERKHINLSEIKNPFLIMDDILKQLNDKTEIDPIEEAMLIWSCGLMNEGVNLSNRDREIIMNKMEKDGFVKSGKYSRENRQDYTGGI